ncbi:TPA: hypothetical protein I9742_002941 [Serratia marcescens]|nr:hypothetical protein [Serratia marcescens]
MKIKVMGEPATFNNRAIQTSKPNLAIALKVNGASWVNNSWFGFSYPNKPVLQAVPIKGSGDLTAGQFSAAATLMVDYQ